MTLDPNARQVRQVVTVAPSPAASGTDFHVDFAQTYEFNAFEQTTPFKIAVYPNGEQPTKQNAEIILVNAYSLGTRLGTITAAEVQAGAGAPGAAQITRQQPGDATIPQSEIQTLTLVATAGTYTLSFDGQTTAAINWNDTAATIQTRLRALSSIGSTGVTVTGSVGGPFTITFAGSLANTSESLITADATLLVYGAAGTVAIARVTAGGGGNNEVQTVTVNGTAGTYALSFGGQTTVPLTPGASPATIQTELQALSSIGSGNVAVTGQAGGPYTVTFQGAMANTGESLVTADQTLLTNGGQNEIQKFLVDADGGTFRLSADGGTNYTSAIAYNATAATVQAALQALTAIGSGNCVVALSGNGYAVTFVGARAASAVTLMTVDATSLVVTTAEITSSVRGQDGTAPRTILVGDHIEVVQSAQGSNSAIGTLATAASIVIAPGASLMQSGATLQLQNTAVADPVSAPGAVAQTTGGSLATKAFPQHDYWLVGYTWVDGSGHETKLSPTTQVDLGWDDSAGSTGSILITLPPTPANATGFHIYAIHATSGTLKRQAAATYVSSETVSPTTMTTYNSGGAAPPGSNNFGSVSPAEILDPSGAVIIAADLSHFSAATPAADSGSGGPGTAKTFARSDHFHPLPSGLLTYRKTTGKTVVSSTGDVDLFNSEITLAANDLGTNKLLEGTAFGDLVQNSGSVQNGYRFKLKLGATTIIDSGAPATAIVTSATRFSWRAWFTIMNLGATNSQYATLWLEMTMATGAGSTFGSANPTTGTGRVVGAASSAGTNNTIRYMIVNTAAVDTTASCALVLSVVLPVNSASVDCALAGALVKVT